MGRQAKLKASVDHWLKIEARRRRAEEDRDAIRDYLRQEFGGAWPEIGESWLDFLSRHISHGDMKIRIEEGERYQDGVGATIIHGPMAPTIPYRRIRSLLHPFRAVDLPLR